ncbi:MAG: polymerase [Acidimicrobiaceae bacterium]|nr:polymerase [Acidimicrobiaceae bacterium]
MAAREQSGGPSEPLPEEHPPAALDVLHLDMDSFFAAVEVQRDPTLVGRPVVVGGTGPRGVVASASYEARVFGIRSAMPTAVARGLCPDAVFLAGRFDVYGEVSRRLREILESATPIVEPVALDEAYLDVSGSHRLVGPSRSIAEALRRRVRDELQLECAVGVGRTKLIAKLASKAAKPVVGPSGVVPGPGVVVVEAADELDFLHRHPVRAIPGVGPRTAERLARFGVSSVGDLASVGRESLVRLLGASSGRALHDLAWGRDSRPVVAERAARSIGHEETFAEDIRDGAVLARRARESATAVAGRCRAGGVEARTVTLKVRFADFSTVTRSRTLARPADTASVIGDAACELLVGLDTGTGVRLIGVHASALVVAEQGRALQLQLFGGEERPGAPSAGEDGDPRDEIEAATEAICQRFGAGAIALLGDQARSGPRSGPAGPVA